MRYNEAKKYISLKRRETSLMIEISQIECLLKMEAAYYSSPSLTSVPSSAVSSPTENLAISNLEMRQELKERHGKAKTELEKIKRRIKRIDEFINTIANEEIKGMAELHFKQGWSFSKIARFSYVSRNFVSKKIKSVCER